MVDVGIEEVTVAQSRGESTRSVHDLRNIVDRLDVMMGGGGGAVDHDLATVLREQAERVAALEAEVEELRTLVNHLMTIATWQAKVTATLVGDDDVPDDRTDERERPADEAVHAHGGDREHTQERRRRSEPSRSEPQSRRPSSLDDDIDEILGTDSDAQRREPPPPDFGI